MAETFHNTTNETGVQLEAFTKKAQTQDEVVLTFFKNHLNHDFSPSKLYEYLIKHSLIDNTTPLTSIRRALTNLTVAGKLTKTNRTVISRYGRSEYVWQLKKETNG
jgi:hypothetical protein